MPPYRYTTLPRQHRIRASYDTGPYVNIRTVCFVRSSNILMTWHSTCTVSILGPPQSKQELPKSLRGYLSNARSTCLQPCVMSLFFQVTRVRRQVQNERKKAKPKGRPGAYSLILRPAAPQTIPLSKSIDYPINQTFLSPELNSVCKQGKNVKNTEFMQNS